MSYTYRVTTDAALDVIEAALYLERQRKGYGLKFRENLNKLLDFLCSNPKTAAILYDNRHKAYLRSFKYHVIYTINEDVQEIEIIMVIHHSRNPKRWESR